MIKVFVSYSHKDEDLRDALERHLALLKNEGTISIWYDRKILAGQEFAPAIDANSSDAQIILLLVSSDFLASSYCWGVEMKLAMRLHDSNAAKVIPVIIRACDWHSAPFGRILAVPKDGKPITSWPNMDEAFYDVAKQICSAAEDVKRPASNWPFSQKRAPRLLFQNQCRAALLDFIARGVGWRPVLEANAREASHITNSPSLEGLVPIVLGAASMPASRVYAQGVSTITVLYRSPLSPFATEVFAARDVTAAAFRGDALA